MRAVDIYEELLRMERDDALFSLTYKGVAWWNLVRFTLVYDLVLSEGVAGMHPDTAPAPKHRLPPAAVAAALRGVGQCLSRKKADVLLHGCEGRLGEWMGPEEAGALPFTFIKNHITPLGGFGADHQAGASAPSKEIDNALPALLCLPKWVWLAVRRRLVGMPRVPGLAPVLEKLEKLSGKPLEYERYNDMVVRQCLAFRQYRWFYRRVLRHRFKAVVTGCHYTTEAFALTCAAQGLGVPVAELQHGVTGPRHAGYNVLPQTPGGAMLTADTSRSEVETAAGEASAKRAGEPQRAAGGARLAAGAVYFPDVLLSFGDYWNSVTRTPPGCKAAAVGYPAFERARAACAGVPKDAGPVVFYSQGAVSREMADFALCFHRLGTGRRVLLKLHPNEYKSWRQRTPQLENSGVEVLDGPTAVYRLLAQYQNHVGAFSTVLYEAMAFPGNRVFTVEPVSCRYMDLLIAAGQIGAVQTPGELARQLEDIEGPPRVGIDPAQLFRPGAAANIRAAIAALVTGEGQGGP